MLDDLAPWDARHPERSLVLDFFPLDPANPKVRGRMNGRDKKVAGTIDE